MALLGKGLAGESIDVVELVANVGLSSRDETAARYQLIQARSFGMACGSALAPALVFKALALQRRDPADLFHLHFPDPISHPTSMKLPRNVPRVITWHSDVIRQKRLPALYKSFLWRVARQSSASIAATQAYFDASTQIPKDIPANRRHVIPYGLDYAPLELSPRTGAQSAALRARAQGEGWCLRWAAMFITRALRY